MQRDEDLERAVDSIYDAAVGGVQWSDALTKVVSAASCRTALLHLFDPKLNVTQVVATLGFEDADICAYETYYGARDLWRSVANASVPPMRATIFTDLISEREWERSEVWNDWVKHSVGAFYCLAGKFLLPGQRFGYIGIHRPHGAKDFTTKDAAVLQALLPHLRRALLVRESLTEANSARLRALEALDALAIGVIFVDSGCRMIHANAAAEAILVRNDGLRRDAIGRLTATVCGETQQLHRLVADAAPRAVGRPSSAGGAIGITRAEPLGPLALMVSPLPAERLPIVGAQPIAMLLVSDPQARPVAQAETLIALYGLTAAEGRLTAALGTGATLEDAARSLCITPNTARWHLKHVFEKLGVHHQTELVALVAALPTSKFDRGVEGAGQP
jgi:DNA-binding CsgD family transcriptional regulator